MGGVARTDIWATALAKSGPLKESVPHSPVLWSFRNLGWSTVLIDTDATTEKRLSQSHSTVSWHALRPEHLMGLVLRRR